MRLIDADELLKQIQTTYCRDCKECNKDKDFFHCRIEQIIGDIHYAPTVDLWHYPSKGEYPKDDEEVLVIAESDHSRYKSLETYYPDKNEWSTVWKIIAWQYIVPPKEEA